MEVEFTKMHGAGNDYIYVDARRYELANPSHCARVWSSLHTGIGSDGLVLIGRSAVADFSMRIFNADGSEARMCGNASRCIGKYVYDKGLTDKTELMLETLSGIKPLKLQVQAGEVTSVTVDMGAPREVGSVDLTSLVPQFKESVFVDMGNPHVVIFVEDIRSVDLPVAGPLLERNARSNGRVNVEFVQQMAEASLRMRVWERGSGITLACGTGACATFVASRFTRRCGAEAGVDMDGGRLRLEWNAGNGHVLMSGPAVTVFEGKIKEPV